jgi:hypothetical protein
MMTLEELGAAVDAGIQLLNGKRGPGWCESIDREILDLKDGDCCILGQVYAEDADDEHSGYEIGLEDLGASTDADTEGYAYGFAVNVNDVGRWSRSDAPGIPNSPLVTALHNRYKALQYLWEKRLDELCPPGK